MARAIFMSEHEDFRLTARSFIAREIAPHLDAWSAVGLVDREVWLKAGQQGLLGLNIDEEYGGGGADFLFNTVLSEELLRAGAGSVTLPLGNDIVSPYLSRYASPAQKQRWLPGIAAGTLIPAIAMTEPTAGSDLRAIRTALKPDGDDFLLNGQKTFITNGILADLVIVAAQWPNESGSPRLTLVVAERGMDGFERGSGLHKVGRHAADTAELFFDNVKIPATNILGELGHGFGYLVANLAQERLSIAVSAVATAQRALEITREYCAERQAFGQPIGSHQAIRFALAEMATEVEIAQVFLDDCLRRHVTDDCDASRAAMAKWWTTELEKRVVDQCVQLHGGYGYMTEYEIARIYMDTRIQTIYGGTTEIMKDLIGKSMGF